MMNKGPRYSAGLVSTILILQILIGFLAMVVVVPQGVEGVDESYIKYHSDLPERRLPIYFHDADNYQYYRTEFMNNKEYIVTGVHVIYSTEAQALWRGIIEVKDFINSVEYPLSLPSTPTIDDSKPYFENFNGPRFMITKSMFTLSMSPDAGELNSGHMWFEKRDISETTHTFIGDVTGWKPLSEYELIMSAMVEPIVDMQTGVENAAGGIIDDKDNLDLYRVLLVGNTTYTFNLINPDRSPFSFKLYDVAEVIDNPLMEETGNQPTVSFDYTPIEDSYYYLMAEFPNNRAFIDYQVNIDPNLPPTALIDGDELVNVNQSAYFTAENSTDDDGDKLKYSWDFDDSDGVQEEATKTDPRHVYRKAGLFTVTLTVSDGKEMDVATWSVLVNARPLGDWEIVDVILNETMRLNFDQEYTFKATFSDLENHQLSFKWDFGDGNSSTTATTIHTFEQLGTFTYDVKLTVSDLADKTMRNKELIFNQLPSAKIEEPQVVPRVGKKIDFEAYGRDTDGFIQEYRWDFDSDGTVDSTTDEPYASHTFTKAGEYNVTFMVVDNNGGIGKAYYDLDVKKKVVVEADYTGAIAGGVVAIVIVVVLLIVYLKVLKKPKTEEPAPQVPPTQAPAQVHDGGQQQQTEYAALYGQDQYGSQQQPDQSSGYGQEQYGSQQQPDQSSRYGQDQQYGQQYGQQHGPPQHPPAQQQQTGPRLVPPPGQAKPQAGPTLVPPPKPPQKPGPRLVPPPKPG